MQNFKGFVDKYDFFLKPIKTTFDVLEFEGSLISYFRKSFNKLNFRKKPLQTNIKKKRIRMNIINSFLKTQNFH